MTALITTITVPPTETQSTRLPRGHRGGEPGGGRVELSVRGRLIEPSDLDEATARSGDDRLEHTLAEHPTGVGLRSWASDGHRRRARRLVP